MMTLSRPCPSITTRRRQRSCSASSSKLKRVLPGNRLQLMWPHCAHWDKRFGLETLSRTLRNQLICGVNDDNIYSVDYFG